MNSIEQDNNDYNFERFPRYVLGADITRTVERHGIHPGEAAPDFELPLSSGDLLRLRGFRGRPVLLHFGSYS